MIEDTGNIHLLPDSRANTGKQGVMTLWQLPDGTQVRCEAVEVFCANCGKLFGHVPKENTAFTFWLCNKCFETWGSMAGTMALPDDLFMQAVAEEMEAAYGKTLTAEEIVLLKEIGKLSPALEQLEKESPFKVYNPA